MANEELEQELERFEKEAFEAGHEDTETVTEPEVVAEDTPTAEPEADETGQEAESVTPADNSATSEEPEIQGSPEGGEKETIALTTLPDDKDAFGSLAGQKVTAQQIIEAGLLEKLVTWGHQGRYMVQKGQKELEEAKTAQSEAEKLRLLLEDRFKKEDETAQQKAAPVVSEEAFATALTNEYLPGLKAIAEAGGIEKDFLADFPKATAHIEHRFQSGAQLLQGLIKEVDDLRGFVGMQKAAQQKQTATSTFEGVLDKASQSGELFKGLADAQGKVDFIKWVTADDTGLRIAEKDIKDVTTEDVQSAWLYYLHTHPEALKVAAPVKVDKQAHLAGGGGGKAPSRKTKDQMDEFEAFEVEHAKSQNDAYAE